MMNKVKTIETTENVSNFVRNLEKERLEDCLAIIGIMEKQTGFPPKMWGPGIIGFGSYHYIYETGRQGDAPLVAFSPRKSEFALYIAQFEGRDAFMKKLGKHRAGKGCIYVKQIHDIDTDVLKKLIEGSVSHYRTKYP
ncbi:MAG: DUF1801 domain-containing protein [Flavisolibacter sp.]